MKWPSSLGLCLPIPSPMCRAESADSRESRSAQPHDPVQTGTGYQMRAVSSEQEMDIDASLFLFVRRPCFSANLPQDLPTRSPRNAEPQTGIPQSPNPDPNHFSSCRTPLPRPGLMLCSEPTVLGLVVVVLLLVMRGRLAVVSETRDTPPHRRWACKDPRWLEAWLARLPTPAC